jgi:hypothetical protein
MIKSKPLSRITKTLKTDGQVVGSSEIIGDVGKSSQTIIISITA